MSSVRWRQFIIVPEKVEETHDEPWSCSAPGLVAVRKSKIDKRLSRQQSANLDADDGRVSLAVPVFALCPHTSNLAAFHGVFLCVGRWVDVTRGYFTHRHVVLVE